MVYRAAIVNARVVGVKREADLSGMRDEPWVRGDGHSRAWPGVGAPSRSFGRRRGLNRLARDADNQALLTRRAVISKVIMSTGLEAQDSPDIGPGSRIAQRCGLSYLYTVTTSPVTAQPLIRPGEGSRAFPMATLSQPDLTPDGLTTDCRKIDIQRWRAHFCFLAATAIQCQQEKQDNNENANNSDRAFYIREAISSHALRMASRAHAHGTFLFSRA